jgi:tripartite-type tricarboxylate transporter receptor subunit TctC
MHAAAFAHIAGIKADHIPYRGTPEAVNDAMNGRVVYAFAPGPNAVPLAKSGKLQILATTSIAGTRFYPGVPTLVEAGVAYEGDDWFGIFAPAKTPLELRTKLAKEIERILALPDVRERLATFGAEPDYIGPDEWQAFAVKYIASMRKLGDEVGIKPQ